MISCAKGRIRLSLRHEPRNAYILISRSDRDRGSGWSVRDILTDSTHDLPEWWWTFTNYYRKRILPLASPPSLLDNKSCAYRNSVSANIPHPFADIGTMALIYKYPYSLYFRLASTPEAGKSDESKVTVKWLPCLEIEIERESLRLFGNKLHTSFLGNISIWASHITR